MINGEGLPEQRTTGLKVALRIISGWEATPSEVCRILRISPAIYSRSSRGTATGQRLDQDQQQAPRLSLPLASHKRIRRACKGWLTCIRPRWLSALRLRSLRLHTDPRPPAES